MRNPFKLIFPDKKINNKPSKVITKISLGMESVQLTITHMNRRTIALSVSSKDGQLEVKVPLSMSDDEALKFVYSKLDWIVRKRRELFIKLEKRIIRQYKDGAKHLFLGQTFELKVIEQRKRIKPHLNENTMLIYADSEEIVKRQLRAWYKDQSAEQFVPIIVPIIEEFYKRYRKSPSSMEYKFVTSYWGVCTSKGIIKLNIELLRGPKVCIEYIMAHELCHLIHANHSPRFYKLLTEFMPDWQQRKKILEQTISCKD